MAEPSADAVNTAHAAAAELFGRAHAAISEVVRGKAEVVELALVAVMAGGHILVQDVPGVGKTTLAHALATALGGEFRRIQFTSDLLPGDITGVNILDSGAGGGFRFRQGPLFANVVLADEINRATPKTQSALLEAMAERHTTVDGTSHALPQPFTVIATQNPHDYQGTYALPDSQLDRFLLRISMGYPDRGSERTILRTGGARRAEYRQALDASELQRLIDAVGAVSVHEQVEDYLLDIVEKSRHDARFVRGVSTRGAEALYAAVRALAVARGRAFAIPEDVRDLAAPVLAHRILPRGDASSAATEALIAELIDEVPPPQ